MQLATLWHKTKLIWWRLHYYSCKWASIDSFYWKEEREHSNWVINSYLEIITLGPQITWLCKTGYALCRTLKIKNIFVAETIWSVCSCLHILKHATLSQFFLASKLLVIDSSGGINHEDIQQTDECWRLHIYLSQNQRA